MNKFAMIGLAGGLAAFSSIEAVAEKACDGTVIPESPLEAPKYFINNLAMIKVCHDSRTHDPHLKQDETLSIESDSEGFYRIVDKGNDIGDKEWYDLKLWYVKGRPYDGRAINCKDTKEAASAIEKKIPSILEHDESNELDKILEEYRFKWNASNTAKIEHLKGYVVLGGDKKCHQVKIKIADPNDKIDPSKRFHIEFLPVDAATIHKGDAHPPGG